MKLALCTSIVLLFSQTLLAQRFELVEPSGLATASVEIGRGRLIVYERSGERIYFSRDTRYDSADRRFIGYFNFELNRVLRFPRSGNGALQTADLDDKIPRYRNTIRAARPVRADGYGGHVTGDLRPVEFGFTNSPHAYPYASGYRNVVPRPQSVLIDSETVPDPALPPARVVFHNSGPREIQLTLIDLQNQRDTRSMQVKPAQTAEVQLARDVGGRRIDHYRVVTPSGESITKEFVSEISPTLRYEVIVYEKVMQSVAIDRTGKSPNVIEDIQFRERELGRFHLPPGPELRPGTIDAYTAARERAGIIAPVPPHGPRSSDSPSPLERAVLEAQRRAQGKQ